MIEICQNAARVICSNITTDTDFPWSKPCNYECVCCECYLNCRTNRRRWTENLWQLTSLRCFLLAWRPLINLCNTWSNILFFKHGTFYSSSKSMPLLLGDWAIFCFLFNKSFSPRGKIITKRKYENGWIVCKYARWYSPEATH